MGMDEADLALAVERHATSKLPDGDLMQIATFGFRGEALPSIASVSRLEIRTRGRRAAWARGSWSRTGSKSAIEPCAARPGARVEARDLFAATPARLKFLKSDRAEALAAADAVKRLAMAAPEVALFVRDRPGLELRLAGRGPGEAGFAERLRQALGDDFAANSVALDASARGAEAHRPRRPADLQPAERAPSSSCSSTGGRCATRRSPARCGGPISISCPPTGMRSRLCSSNASRREVDVNVHPAKAEVRFRDAAAVRGLIVGAIKQRSERGAASGLDHRRDGDDPRHAPAATIPRRVLFSPLGLARLARRARTGRARAGELRRSRALRAPPAAWAERARPRRARLARRGRNCTRTTSSPRPGTALSSSTSTRRMSASSMSGSSLSARRARSSGRCC